MASTRAEELSRLAEAGGDEGDRVFNEFAKEGTPFERVLQGPVKVPAPDDAIPTRVKPPVVKEPKTDKTRATNRSTASERELADLTDQLTEQVGTIAGIIHGVAPVTSVYAAANSGKALGALVAIAQRHPAMLKGLKKAADGVDAMEIAKFIVGLVMCIQVDTQKLNGDEFPCRMFGVTDILEEYFGPEEPDEPKKNPNLTGLTVPSAYTFQQV